MFTTTVTEALWPKQWSCSAGFIGTTTLLCVVSPSLVVSSRLSGVVLETKSGQSVLEQWWAWSLQDVGTGQTRSLEGSVSFKEMRSRPVLSRTHPKASVFVLSGWPHLKAGWHVCGRGLFLALLHTLSLTSLQGPLSSCHCSLLRCCLHDVVSRTWEQLYYRWKMWETNLANIYWKWAWPLACQVCF